MHLAMLGRSGALDEYYSNLTFKDVVRRWKLANTGNKMWLRKQVVRINPKEGIFH